MFSITTSIHRRAFWFSAPATMRAAAISAPGVAVVSTVDVPDPGPGEVLLRLEGSGVCASNLPVWEGREWWFRARLFPWTIGFAGLGPTGGGADIGPIVVALQKR